MERNGSTAGGDDSNSKDIMKTGLSTNLPPIAGTYRAAASVVR